MTAKDRLDSLYKMMVGASLAFYVCHYIWGVEQASNAGAITGLGWVTVFFWSRLLKNRGEANPA